MEHMKEISQVREELDGIDKELLALFEKRLDLVNQVAEIKRQGNISITDEKREQAVIDQALELTRPENRGEVISFTRSLISLAKLRQRTQLLDFTQESLLPPAQAGVKRDMEVAYQGLPGAWGEGAATRLFPEGKLTNQERFEDVFVAVKEQKVRYGVLPIENSLTGAIGEVYELLRKYGCYIVGQTWVDIKQCLLALPGTDIREVREVFSHPVGFGQCNNFLKKHDWDLTACRNTAVAASLVAERQEKRLAAIGSPRAADLNGLVVLDENIVDDKSNRTRFIAIAKAPEYDDSSDIVSVTFHVNHRSGALCDVIFPFMAEHINLTRIESQPAHGGNYCFFADLQGNIKDDNVSRGIHHAAAASGYLEVLGCYKDINGAE